MAFSELRLYTTKASWRGAGYEWCAGTPATLGRRATGQPVLAGLAEPKFMVEICFSFGKSSLCDWKVLYWSMGTFLHIWEQQI